MMKGLCHNCLGEGCRYCCGSGQDISLDDDDEELKGGNQDETDNI